MFEHSEENRTAVVLTMSDGETMQGTVRLPLSNKLADALNGTEPFLDFVAGNGERSFVSKRFVWKIAPVEIPRADHLSRHEKDRRTFDPHEILGISRGAPASEVRQAYHNLARRYHPDRFAGLELPPEIQDYATAMLARINLAYKQLQGSSQSSTAASSHGSGSRH